MRYTASSSRRFRSKPSTYSAVGCLAGSRFWSWNGRWCTGPNCGTIGCERNGTSRCCRSRRSTRRAEMERVKSVKALPGYRLEVEFSDGVRGVLDYSDRLFGPMMEPLRDPERFAEVGVSEG